MRSNLKMCIYKWTYIDSKLYIFLKNELDGQLKL